MRIALLTSSWDGDEWSERSVALRRVAGALAPLGELDVLVTTGAAGACDDDGALRVLRFAALRVPGYHRRAILECAIGPEGLSSPTLCACATRLAPFWADVLPEIFQREVAETVAPPSPALVSHLRERRYELIVFGGLDSIVFDDSLREAVARARVALVPLARDEPRLYFSVYDELLRRAERVVVFSEHERYLLVERRGVRGGRQRTRVVGLPLRVNPIAMTTSPYRSLEKSYVVLARDWRQPFALGWVYGLADALARTSPEIELALVGPGAGSLPPSAGVLRQETHLRVDAWRWMNGALAFLDPEPNRFVGQDVLEAMLCSTPVLVPAHGGAAREHAEVANGGLWYRTLAELHACLQALRSKDLRETLGDQGRHYAEGRYGDVDGFVRRVREAILGDGE